MFSRDEVTGKPSPWMGEGREGVMLEAAVATPTHTLPHPGGGVT
jgi:hypothetical protein